MYAVVRQVQVQRLNINKFLMMKWPRLSKQSHQKFLILTSKLTRTRNPQSAKKNGHLSIYLHYNSANSIFCAIHSSFLSNMETTGCKGETKCNEWLYIRAAAYQAFIWQIINKKVNLSSQILVVLLSRMPLHSKLVYDVKLFSKVKSNLVFEH